MDKPVVRVSVRNLVEFILRSGDLDSRRGTADKEAMQKGSRLHRKIQRQMGGNYRAEVSLKQECIFEDVTIVLEGRADGIFTEQDMTYIDEIKGVYRSLENLTEPVRVHRAQAMCYGKIYLEQEKLEKIGIQITYANLDSEEIRRFREVITREELFNWYEELMSSYHKWISFHLKWKMQRDESMKSLEFPFPYRPGQRKMVTGIYHTISQGKQIFVQAPTGVGKTMSTVFPAVRAIGEGKADAVFYLTAKTITRTVAEEAFSILKKNGLKFKVITLTAKEKMCICEKPECNPDRCPYAKGHFDRINDAVFEIWTGEESYDRDKIKQQADKWQVCPFELGLDLAVWSDGVICDYNYAFDPNAHLKRFFGESVSGKYVFLIDEAHNLVERGREMYSACICKEDIMDTRKRIKESCPGLAKALNRINKQLVQMKKTCEQYEILDNVGTLAIQLLNVQGEMDKVLEEPPRPEAAEEILDLYFYVRDFLNVSELIDDNYVIYSEIGEDGKFRVKLYCVNPAENLKKYLEKSAGTIFFSATLLPMLYYRKLLSTEKDDFGIYVQSPFNKENRQILMGIDVSSRYTRRNYTEYRKIAEYIARTAWKKKGNYLVFFPSYKLLEAVYDIYENEFSADWVQCICQTASMNEYEREEFLEQFTERENTLVGFCVLGGIFSEGIDLIGNRLIGVLIVGTGLPQISNEREILKRYYDKKGENGFDYAYRYPGMNKVLQAAGRVIRTQEDSGVIILLDERFYSQDYMELFPVEWSDMEICSLNTLEDNLGKFWDKTKFVTVE